MAFYIPARLDGNDIKMRRVEKVEFDKYGKGPQTTIPMRTLASVGSAIDKALEYIDIDPYGLYSLGLKELGAIALTSTLLPAAIGMNIRANDVLRYNLDTECTTSQYIGKPASNHKVALAHSEARSARHVPETQPLYQTALNNIAIPIIWSADLASSLLTLLGTEMAVHDHNRAFHSPSSDRKPKRRKKGSLFADSTYR